MRKSSYNDRLGIMVETNDRRLPVGIQSFEEIRKQGYLYVDKTDVIWQLANKGKTYNYLIRPRRFGKSVLVDTLEAYFMGKKELFEGLKIMQMEKEWVKRPVIRLDMSRAGAEPGTLRSYLDITFDRLEEEYGITPKPTAQLADRFDAIIQTAYKQTSQQVAILIDEYDSPLQHSWKTPQHEACTAVYREVFAILKADDKYEKFVFITGITKFTQISLFSVLNNLSNISFEPEYAAICGITKEEVLRDFKPEIHKLAEYEDWTFDEAIAQLTAYYDGYHFSRRNMVDVFNPFSLVKALNARKIAPYWFGSGTPTYLIKTLQKYHVNVMDIEKKSCDVDDFDVSPEMMTSALPLLYQSGYLTIKKYNPMLQRYTLEYPNREVKIGMLKSLAPNYLSPISLDNNSLVGDFLEKLYEADVEGAMVRLKAYLASISNRLSNKNERDFQTVFYLIFNLMGAHMRVEEDSVIGRADAVVYMPDTVFVFELKYDGSAEEAIRQIDEKGYLIPYSADGKRLFKIGVNYDSTQRTIGDWIIKE